MPKISLFEKENTDPEKREAKNRREKAYKFVYQRTYTSGFVIVVALLAFFMGFIPLGIFGLIPSAIAELLLMAFVASMFAFLPARWYHIRYNDVPRDYIFEANAGNEEKIVRYEYYRGHFSENYEFKGQPLTWNTKYGRKAYLVRSIDQNEQVAECPELGEYSDIELMNKVQRIEQQRLRNRRFAKIGIKVRPALNTIIEKIQSHYVNKLHKTESDNTLVEPEILERTLEEEIPELSIDEPEKSEDSDIQTIIEEVDADITLNTEDLREQEND